MKVRYRFIREHRAEFPVRMMCKVLEVSSSAFYDWDSQQLSAREKENRKLMTLIEITFRSHRGRYGAPRVHKALRKQGVVCSKNRVARLMREAGLRSKYRKRKKPKAPSPGRDSQYAPNHLNRDFEAHKPGDKWVTDIKYINTKEGWSYLCVVLDLYSREVVGWSLDRHMEDSLVVGALEDAVKRKGLTENGLVHSDRGSQFTSKRYQEALSAHGVVCSMSRKGNCWDNAAMESFFGSLEQEELSGKEFDSIEVLRGVLFWYIEIYYNRQRLHSTLGYRTPHEVSQEANGILSFTLSGISG